MKWKCSKSEFILIVIIIIILIYNIVSGAFRKINTKEDIEVVCDTTYNSVIIDSLIYNIQYKDSIIYNITYEYETEYIKAENLDDSSAVELFKRLCTDNSLYGGDL